MFLPPKPTPPTSAIPDPQVEQQEKQDLASVVDAYMPLVRHAVHRLVAGSNQSSILQYEDMVSCGVKGLIEAHRSYDPTRGVAKFSTFALPRIRGSILDALRAAHPLPRSLQKVASDIEKATVSLYAELGRSPSKAELAVRLGLSIDEFFAAARASSVRILSIEGLAEAAADGAIERPIDIADEDPGINPDAVTQRKFLHRRLLLALRLLPKREREIVRLYYLESRSLRTIGRGMSLSESRVSQLRLRGIGRLRTAMHDDLPNVA